MTGWFKSESTIHFLFFLLPLQGFEIIKVTSMKRKQIILRVIYVLIAIIVIASMIAYFVLAKDREWLAFFVACCGGVLIVNLIIMLIFVQKNLK